VVKHRPRLCATLPRALLNVVVGVCDATSASSVRHCASVQIALAVGAGCVFPVALAAFATWLGGMLGCIATWTVGRLLLRNFFNRVCFSRSPTLQQLDRAIGRVGWRLVLVLRVPYVPFVQLNYFLSVSAVSFPHYVGATAVGTVPVSRAVVVWVGDVTGSLPRVAVCCRAACSMPSLGRASETSLRMYTARSRLASRLSVRLAACACTSHTAALPWCG
jgi:membrane protein YqaA with SNARE-associated domain